MKGWGSTSSLHADINEEIETKIMQFEKMLNQKDEVIRKQQELIEEQKVRLDRLEEWRDSGHDSEDNEKNIQAHKVD